MFCKLCDLFAIPPLFFRMEFDDFKANFDKIEICNLTPDSLTDNVKRKWEVSMFEGNWIRGSTAGGCRNFIG